MAALGRRDRSYMSLKAEIARHEEPANNKLVDFFIYLSIFLGSSIIFFKQPFEGYFHYVIYLLLLPYFVGRFGVPSSLFRILLLPLFAGIFQILMGNNEVFSFIKIFFGMLLSGSFYYYVVVYYEFDTEKMFKMYLTWAYWTAVIGIVQFISYRIGFKPGYYYGWLLNKGGLLVASGSGVRVTSIYLEPSQMAIMLSPAGFVAILNILRRQNYHYSLFQNIIVLVALYLSRSSTGYFGIFLVFLLAGINFGYIIYLFMLIIVGFFAAWGLYNTVSEFKMRVDSSVALWVKGDLSIENVNSSSFVLYNNSHISWENFKEHPFFGTGLGSHPVAYSRYSYTNADEFKLQGFEFNTQDANSLFLRLMSETGLMGVLFMLLIIFKSFVGYAGDEDDQSWIISSAFLIIILLYLFRQGNYFLNGFPFFVWVYYYNKVGFLNKQEKIVAEQ